jgi:GNAT superfamily N-acetyltransferase
MLSFEDEFLAYALAQAPPMLRQWRRDGLEADLREAVAETLRTVTDEAGAERVAEIMHGLKLPAASYRGRLLDVGGMRLLAHIDFPNPSGDFPFVKIRRASEPPGSIADRGPLFEGIARAFAQFRPRAIHFFHPLHLPLRVPAARVDMHLLAAPAGDIAGRPDAVGLGRVALRASAGLDFYPQYEAAYAQMLDDRPALRGEVGPESRESLSECLAQGLLREVFVDDAWSGLIAARRDLIAGVRGLQVVEIVLTRDARGQGLGPAVHQRFARLVAATDLTTILMGTIWAKNTPSLRTALRAGRLEVGAFYWVDL